MSIRPRVFWVGLFVSLCEINYANKQGYKFFKLVYEKITYKDTFFISENLWINIFFICIIFFISSKINQIQMGSKRMHFDCLTL
jgi:hypothetical protein